MTNNVSIWRLIMTETSTHPAISPTTHSTETLLPLVTKLVAQRCSATDLDQLQEASPITEFGSRRLASERAKPKSGYSHRKGIVRSSEVTA